MDGEGGVASKEGRRCKHNMKHSTRIKKANTKLQDEQREIKSRRNGER
jgi:hypothetical protein